MEHIKKSCLPLPNAIKTIYASGNFGKSMLWTSMELFFLFYLTDVLGISPSIAGVIVLIGLVWDGITDPLIGSLMDKYKNKFPKYAPYLLLGAPITSLSFIFLFAPLEMDEISTIIYIVIMSIIFRTCYSVIDVPHNAMLSSLTQDSKTRSDLAGLRFLFSSLGAIAVSTGISLFLLAGDHDSQQQSFFIFAILAACLSNISLYICYFGTKKFELTLTMEHTPLKFSELWQAIWVNKQLWLVFTLMAVSSLSLPLFTKAIIYYAKYVIMSESSVGYFLSYLAIGKGLSIPFWVYGTRKFGKKNAAVVAYISCAILLFIFMHARVQDVTYLYLLSAMLGVSMAGTSVVIWSIIPDVVDYGQWKTGIRADALIFGFFTFASKVSMGASAAILGFALGLNGFVANVEQSIELIDTLQFVMFMIPIIGCTVCVISLSKYRLDENIHKYLVRRLNERSAK